VITTTGADKLFVDAQKNEAEALQSTDQEILQAALSFVTKKLVAGIYEIAWYAEISLALGATGYVMAVLDVDGETKCQSKNDSAEWLSCSGFDTVAKEDGESITASILYRRLKGTGSVQIRNARLIVRRLTLA